MSDHAVAAFAEAAVDAKGVAFEAVRLDGAHDDLIEIGDRFGNVENLLLGRLRDERR